MKAELVKNVTKIFQIVLVKYSLVTISKKNVCYVFQTLQKSINGTREVLGYFLVQPSEEMGKVIKYIISLKTKVASPVLPEDPLVGGGVDFSSPVVRLST